MTTTPDLSPNDLSHFSDEEFNAFCPQGEHVLELESISPAAEAVLDAFLAKCDGYAVYDARRGIAAALRVAANQDPYGLNTGEYDEGWGEAMATVIAIATELEGQ